VFSVQLDGRLLRTGRAFGEHGELGELGAWHCLRLPKGKGRIPDYIGDLTGIQAVQRISCWPGHWNFRVSVCLCVKLVEQLLHRVVLRSYTKRY
jgi:hypothetical protein